MSTELVKQNNKGMLSESQRESFVNIQKFQKRLHRRPSPSRVKVNPYADGAKYIPIADIEMQLDELYFGLWKTHSFTTKVVANEIIGEIMLEVFHPVAEVWLSRVGAAGVQIQMRSERDAAGNKIRTDITDVSKKIVNTLTKDYPHLKTECIKNAAKSLGIQFGRDLNRDGSPDYTEAIPTAETKAEKHNDLKK